MDELGKNADAAVAPTFVRSGCKTTKVVRSDADW